MDHATQNSQQSPGRSWSPLSTISQNVFGPGRNELSERLRTAEQNIARLERELNEQIINGSPTEQSLIREKQCSGTLKRETKHQKGYMSDQDSSLKRLRARFTALLDQRDCLRYECQMLRTQNDEACKDNAECEERIQDLNDQLRTTQEAKESCEQALQSLQADALSIDPSYLQPEDDDYIERQFSQLSNRIQTWAKRYSLGSVDPHNWPFVKIMSYLKSEVEYFIPFNERGMVNESLCEPDIRHRVPRLVLHAWVNFLVYDGLFRRPFFFLDRLLEDNTSEGNNAKRDTVAEDLIGSLLDRFQKYDPKAGSDWRCDLLRLLQPFDTPSDAPEVKAIKDQSKARTDAAVERCCNNLTTKLAWLAQDVLGDSTYPNAYDELTSIFKEAATFSSKLWARKSTLEVVGGNSLAREGFSSQAAHLKAHALHNAVLDRDPTALDGKQIAIILSPAIIVHGKSNGSDYDIARVWKKAEVLVDITRPARVQGSSSLDQQYQQQAVVEIPMRQDKAGQEREMKSHVSAIEESKTVDASLHPDGTDTTVCADLDNATDGISSHHLTDTNLIPDHQN